MAPRRAAPGIPVSVPKDRAIARREQFTGKLPLKFLKRLAPMLNETDGELSVDLGLSSNVAGGWLKGTISGQLELTCQRGLHPFSWEFEVQTELLLVDSETEEDQAMADSDPYLVQDGRLPLQDIVEDEVLLALPMMPRCQDPDCIDRFLK